MDGKALLLAAAGGAICFLGLYLLLVHSLVNRGALQKRIRVLQYTNGKSGVERLGAASQADLARLSLQERILQPFLQSISRYISRFTPKAISDMLAQRLLLAGRQQASHNSVLAAVWVLLFLSGGLFMLFFVLRHGSFSLLQRAVLLVVGFLAGGTLPFLALQSMIQRRQKAIRKQLPEVLDMLCVSVQAGLAFDGALSKISERMKGPFIDECRRALQDIRMGRPRRQALQNMAVRCGLQEVQLFITAILQSDQLGTSMGKTLLIQADNMRERSRQQAKAQALKAPVKMVFPLILFIFPAIFVVALLPALLTMMKTFGR